MTHSKKPKRRKNKKHAKITGNNYLSVLIAQASSGKPRKKSKRLREYENVTIS